MPDENEDLQPQQQDEQPEEQEQEQPSQPAEPTGAAPDETPDEQPADEQPADEEVEGAGDAEESGEEGEEAQDDTPKADFDIEDLGGLRKKITVTVSAERIVAKREEMFGELSNTAQVPGFRIGRAPRRLIEKRFGREVTQDVRNAVVGESLGQMDEQTDLKVLGQPDLDLENIELPESGPLEYSFEVEVAPEFELPELKGIQVEQKGYEVTDYDIEEMLRQRQAVFARFDVSDEAADGGDFVTADTKVLVEGDDPATASDQRLRVAPGQVEGLPLIELGTALTGKKTGETATVTVDVPQAHPHEAWRGKQATIEIAITQVEKQVLPALDDEFAKRFGMDTIQEVRDTVRQSLTMRVAMETRRQMREQVRQHLLDSTDLEVPEKAAENHTERILERQEMDLLSRGVPRDRIDEHMTELRASAGETAQRELKLMFILGQVAEKLEIEVTDEEVNSAIAQLAARNNRRPERVRQELEANGSLSSLQANLQDEKILDTLLSTAVITQPATETDEPDDEEPEADEPETDEPDADEPETDEPEADEPNDTTEPQDDQDDEQQDPPDDQADDDNEADPQEQEE